MGRLRVRGEGDSAEPLGALRRELLRDAIADIQGSIRANDGKSSAALLVHGLLFAGIVTVSVEAVPIYERADSWQRILTLGALASASLAFLTSVWHLARAVTPYHPTSLRRRIQNGHPGLFFPLLHDLRRESDRSGVDELSVYVAKLRAADAVALETDYAAELIKLADIRRHEAGHARAGYFWLRLELLLVSGYLTFVAVVGLTQLGVS